MPSTPSLTSTLQEQTGLTVEDLAPAPAPEELEPLPPLLPPEGIVASRLRDVAGQARSLRGGRLDVAGIRGCAGAAVAAAIARAGSARGLCHGRPRRGAAPRRRRGVPGAWRARRRRGGDRARARSSSSRRASRRPYADVNPDRRAAMSRMATLSHLAHDRPWSRARRPRGRARAQGRPRVPSWRERADRIVAEEELDRDALVRVLVEAGYLRVPVVEDPGSLRGARRAARRVAALDRAAGARRALRRPRPSIKPFDPVEQTTLEGTRPTLGELWLPPAREAILDARSVARARARVTAARRGDRLADDARRARSSTTSRTAARSSAPRVSCPRTTRARAAARVRARRRASSCSTIRRPSRARVRDELERADADAARRSERAALPAAAVLRRRGRRRGATRARAPVVALHRTPSSARSRGGEGPCARASRSRARAARPRRRATTTDLTRAVKAARASKGKNATLAPLVRRIAPGAITGCASSSRRARRRRPSGSRRSSATRASTCKARLAPFDPAWLDEPVGRARRSSSVRCRAACILPADGLVLVTEEEIFGARVHRRAKRARARTPRARSSKTCAVARVGRLRRARRARHRALPGARPQGGRRAHRRSPRDRVRRRRQALPARLSAQPAPEVLGRRERRSRSSIASAARRSRKTKSRVARRPSARWPTSCCACTPSARRQPGDALPARRRRLPRLRGDVPVRRDARTRRAPSTT